MIKTSSLLAIGFVFALGSLMSSFFPSLDLLRIIFSLPFIYFFSGLPLCLFILKSSRRSEIVIFSFAFSLLLTYPAGFLNILWEGQSSQAIYGPHLSGDLFFLFFFFCLFAYLVRKVNGEISLHVRWLLFFPVLLSLILNFSRLDWADQDGNEYDLGYQAYNLVDGIAAGRKAYALSFNSHPPLSMYISHFNLQVLSPHGLSTLSDWMYRFAPATLGVLTVGIVFYLAREILNSSKQAFLAASFLAVNTYHLFLSRIFHREMFLTFFLSLALYSLSRYIKTKSKSYFLLLAFFSGAALLVKESAFIIFPVVFFSLKPRLFLRYLLLSLSVFLPVIVYNFGAYLVTGHMDIFFANLFHTSTNPGATVRGLNHLANLHTTSILLLDVYGWFLLTAYVFALFLARTKILILFLLAVLGFVSFSGVRPYYLPFLSIPLTILLVTAFRNKFLLTIIFIYSFYYSLNTFWNPTLGLSEGYKEDYTQMARNYWKGYSYSARGFLENRGWKQVSSFLAANFSPSIDCLQIDPSDHPLQQIRYLGVNNLVEQHYLGTLSKSRYPLCATDDTHRHWLVTTNNGFVRLSLL